MFCPFEADLNLMSELAVKIVRIEFNYAIYLHVARKVIDFFLTFLFSESFGQIPPVCA
jgi:hypothetical protein